MINSSTLIRSGEEKLLVYQHGYHCPTFQHAPINSLRLIIIAHNQNVIFFLYIFCNCCLFYRDSDWHDIKAIEAIGTSILTTSNHSFERPKHSIHIPHI